MCLGEHNQYQELDFSVVQKYLELFSLHKMCLETWFKLIISEIVKYI